MLTFVASCFNKVLSGEILTFEQSKSTSKVIYRDELNKKQSPSKQKSYYGDSFSSTKPLLKVKDGKDIKRSSTDFDVKASTVRVKVKMTKQEAARLLSKCKDGGILEFRDVAGELVNLPMNRVSVVSPCPGINKVLDTIPEDH
ncbi:uncharacterized protein LOC111291034 [Durio zibethinus]|uniref:Uncharacterized protein LOC111291034 n=1 Tax=Durio zibethinus TaxID=66656 RepID=A0A6P5YCR2_DURZI|nr:uncharacterized protein LOC111291034 [Durio zibethinus]